MKKIIITSAFAFLFSVVNAQTVSIIPQSSAWKYKDNGSNQGTAWRAVAFNDATWATGNAEFGYGDGGEATVVSYGTSSSNKYRTTYFRKSFTVTNPSAYSTFTLGLLRDDGAVVFLNGVEVVRSNMPTGTIGYRTLASANVAGANESTYYSYTINPSSFVAGNNVLAVEVHQASSGSVDLSFNLKLDATPVAATCGTPTSLSSSSITQTTANISWAAVSGATSYNIQYRIVGAGSWTATTSSTTTKSLTGLTANSNYEFQVQAVCAVTGTFSASANFTTLAVPTCGTPTSLSSSSVTSSTASLSWAAVASATSYNIQYRIVGAGGWTATTSSSTTKSLTGLTANSNYEFQVQAVCAVSGTFSASANFTTLSAGIDSLITTNSSWKYLDNGTNQGTAWRASAFNDATWASGNAELGYGDGGEATTVSYGASSTAKYVTTYFRKSFAVTNPAVYTTFNLGVVRDDGIVVYINGTEVYRNNMPTGTIAYNTLSPVAIGGTDESAWTTTALSTSSLVAGNNVMAVEIHQQALTSTDISFNARLYASSVVATPVVTRGAYLQKLSPNGITIRWRTDILCNSQVQYGTSLAYGSATSDAALTTEHIVTLTGLTPATQYFYSIGTTAQAIQGDVKNNFYTAPVTGSTTPVRIWGIGDFGNGSTQQAAVRNAYATYTGTTPTNLWLWLGDDAYSNGTDIEFQNYVFSVYPDQMKSIPLFPSPGNHDYADVGYQSSSALTTNFPYYSIFSVPQNGESGGVASNTPKYYSYNYANIHFISLDSYGALNNTSSPMYQWLNNDLAANTQRWTVVYFHHPPYSLGSHNSNTDNQLINMRTNIVPLLESYHVDLVLAGHSHINERSFLMKGHFGTSTTFTQAMKISTSTNTFTKTPPYNGTVYAVCGTSGQNPGGATASGYPMPCMTFNNNSNNCSVVMDVSGDNFSCKYLASTGVVVDQFTITKTGARTTPPTEEEKTETSFNVYAANDEVMVNYFLPEDASVKIEMINSLGESLKSFDNISSRQAKGFYNYELPIADKYIAAGIYFIRLTMNEKQLVRKINIAK